MMPVESESFKKFVDDCVPNHSMETLFLVLSHAGEHVDEDVSQLVSEARNLYPELESRKILAVDSLLRIAFHDLESRSLSDVMKNAKMKRILSEYVMDANGDHDAVKSAIDKKSNFGELERIIEEFSVRAPALQLVQILKSVQTGIANLSDGWKEGIGLRNKKMEDPQEFEKRIAAMNKALDEYKDKMNTFSRQIQQRYVGTDGETQHKLERLRKNYESRFNDASSKTELLKILSDFEHECGDLLNYVTGQIRADYSKEMKRVGDELFETHDVRLPKLDLAGIEEKAKTEAFAEAERTPGGSGFKYEVGKGVRIALDWAGDLLGRKFTADDLIGNWGKDRKILCEELFLGNLKQQAIHIMQTYSNDIENLCISVIKKYDPVFRGVLTKIITENGATLESLKVTKQSNDDIAGEIRELEDLIKKAHDLNENVTNVMEDLQ